MRLSTVNTVSTIRRLVAWIGPTLARNADLHWEIGSHESVALRNGQAEI